MKKMSIPLAIHAHLWECLAFYGNVQHFTVASSQADAVARPFYNEKFETDLLLKQNLWADCPKFVTVDYVGKATRQTKFGENPSAGVFQAYGWTLIVWLLDGHPHALAWPCSIMPRKQFFFGGNFPKLSAFVWCRGSLPSLWFNCKAEVAYESLAAQTRHVTESSYSMCIFNGSRRCHPTMGGATDFKAGYKTR